MNEVKVIVYHSCLFESCLSDVTHIFDVSKSLQVQKGKSIYMLKCCLNIMYVSCKINVRFTVYIHKLKDLSIYIPI